MNCPSRVDTTDDALPRGWNQNPPTLAPDITTRKDLNHIAGARSRRDPRLAHDEGTPLLSESPLPPSRLRPTDPNMGAGEVEILAEEVPPAAPPKERWTAATSAVGKARSALAAGTRGIRGAWYRRRRGGAVSSRTAPTAPNGPDEGGPKGRVERIKDVLYRYLSFIGPGFLVSVAYIDPGNYATDVSAGAEFRFKFLFMVLLSNIIAIFLQSLCIKLGSVTGMDLAQNCRAHCPKWVNRIIFVFAEAAIIATDIAEVNGFAIALNLLFNVPLVAGCAISIVDVMVILVFYNPDGPMRGVRYFEAFVALLVIGVVVAFCFQLSLISGTTVGDVMDGYLPSKTLFEQNGLYQAAGILGATVMPHSLYLGSGLIQPRLREYDSKLHQKRMDAGAAPPSTTNTGDMTATAAHTGNTTLGDSSVAKVPYRPSLEAIRTCLQYSIAELALSLFTFALFVNSAILIVAGAALSDTPNALDADLFTIHDLLSASLAPVAGTVFALALLLSGISAGIVCTIAGQIVFEGAFHWTIKPWMQRLITRSVSITPSIIIAAAVGRQGLSDALQASQVALSVTLPVVSAPLVYFTCRNRFMTVPAPLDSAPPANPTPNTTAAAATALPDGAAVDADPDAEADADSDAETRSARTVGPGIGMRNGRLTALAGILIWALVLVINVALIILLCLGKS